MRANSRRWWLSSPHVVIRSRNKPGPGVQRTSRRQRPSTAAPSPSSSRSDWRWYRRRRASPPLRAIPPADV